jgi:hypothetical protein
MDSVVVGRYKGRRVLSGDCGKDFLFLNDTRAAGREDLNGNFAIDNLELPLTLTGTLNRKGEIALVAQFTAFDGVIIAANMSSCAARRSSLMLWA